MRSVSSTHDSFTRKHREAVQLAGQLPTYGCDSRVVLRNLEDLASEYTLATSHYVCLAMNGECDSEDVSRYWFTINMHNFPQRLDICIADMITLCGTHPSVRREPKAVNRRDRTGVSIQVGDQALMRIYNQLQQLAAGRISDAATKGGNDQCDCGCAMTVNQEESVYLCTQCGASRKIDGTAFRDKAAGSQDGLKSRNSEYHAMRHFEDWMPRILGTEKKDIPEDVMAKIRAVIARDEVLISELTCERVRSILRDRSVCATNLNDHVTLIIKKLGGVGPPEPTYVQMNLIRSKYRIIMDIYPTIANGGTNIKYYPYFIYKVIEIFFKDVPSVLSINKYIHLQAEHTLKQNDDIFASIVAKTDPEDGFEIIATDRDKVFP